MWRRGRRERVEKNVKNLIIRGKKNGGGRFFFKPGGGPSVPRAPKGKRTRGPARGIPKLKAIRLGGKLSV